VLALAVLAPVSLAASPRPLGLGVPIANAGT
jgi:hypothetical protein